MNNIKAKHLLEKCSFFNPFMTGETIKWMYTPTHTYIFVSQHNFCRHIFLKKSFSFLNQVYLQMVRKLLSNSIIYFNIWVSDCVLFNYRFVFKNHLPNSLVQVNQWINVQLFISCLILA